MKHQKNCNLRISGNVISINECNLKVICQYFNAFDLLLIFGIWTLASAQKFIKDIEISEKTLNFS
ncbi:MAG: hypothetical protein BGO40_07555 [Chryseobacterium sp. 39-10]|nr:MAG: hypothetical protein BGO40_07555 [Chryseobacterium sp. 39-10]